MAKIEDQILSACEIAIADRAGFNTYMFDGAVIRVNEPDACKVQPILAKVGLRHKVSFSVTGFDSLGGSSVLKKPAASGSSM